MEDWVAVVEEAGRFQWIIGNMGLVKGRIAPALVAFDTVEEAVEDFEIQSKAEADSTGRVVLPKEHIQKMIRAIASRCADCHDAYFGGVYWHERDNTGCNWSVSTMRGSDWAGCFDCVQPKAMQLRRAFSIADEA